MSTFPRRFSFYCLFRASFISCVTFISKIDQRKCTGNLFLNNFILFYVNIMGRPRRRQEDNIRMDLEEIGISAGNWVDSAQGRNYWRALVNSALNLRVP